MKQIIRTLFLFGLFFVSFNGYAQDCNELITKVCNTFEDMARGVNKCTSLQQFENLDFDNITNNSGLDDIPDQCMTTILSTADKRKIKLSIGNFVTAVSNKTYQLTGGQLDRESVNSIFEPMKQKLYKMVDTSDTMLELSKQFENFSGM